jgi:hypothetical protein
LEGLPKMEFLFSTLVISNIPKIIIKCQAY